MSHIFLLIGNHQFPSLEKLIQNQQLKNVDVKKNSGIYNNVVNL